VITVQEALLMILWILLYVIFLGPAMRQIREVAMQAHRYNSIHRSNLKLGLDDSFPETSGGVTAAISDNEGMVLRNWAAVPGASGRTALLLPSIRDVLEGSRIQLHSRR
jgi:hypothetical protein